MAFSRNGATLISGSQDNTVKVWSLATGSASATLEARWAECVAFSPDRYYVRHRDARKAGQAIRHVHGRNYRCL